MSLPAAFVQGTRKDGSPNLSHAWARTVDGAQGGTWCGFRGFSYTHFGSIRTPVSGFSYTPAIGEPE
jgi:hypothetical protein